jgi:N-acetyl-gamma-glutamyl-phosphate reductase
MSSWCCSPPTGGPGRRCARCFRSSQPFKLPKLVSIDGLDWKKAALDLAFCALPHATTQKVIGDLLAKAPKTKVVDLSADFRLHDAAAYARWYGHEHHAPKLQGEAVYGLVEVHRDKIKKARLVANPGCYTSCAQLALTARCLRLRQSRRTRSSSTPSRHDRGGQSGERGDAVLRSVGGLPRLWRGASPATWPSSPRVLGGRRPGRVVSFTPHLVPMNRGILSTIYVRGTQGKSAEDLHVLLSKYYAKEPFVHVLPFGQTPQTRHVRGSNMTFIGVAKDRVPGRAIVISALDNLVKGSVGQAVQNMNLMLGYPEAAGLEQVALFP